MRLVADLRKRLGEGDLVLGTFMANFKAAGVVDILKRMGFDFFMVDTEHGYYTNTEVEALIAAGRRCGLCPIVRVSGPNHAEVTHVLDCGAEGILVPMARSLDYVQEAVNQSKYPPLGRRGCHFLRPHTDHNPPVGPEATAELMDRANREIITAIQIETPEAAELVDDIAAMDGVDMLYIGPGDLSITMGLGLNYDHPKVQEVCRRVVEACRRHSKLAGAHFGGPARVAKAFEMGINFLGYAAASRLLIGGAEAYFQDIDAALSDAGMKPRQAAGKES